MNFSERMGYKEVKSLIQTESIDEDLKNGLWNAIWDNYLRYYGDRYKSPTLYNDLNDLTLNIWKDFFKEAIDDVNFGNPSLVGEIKSYFYYHTTWNELYDFVEFLPNNFHGIEEINEYFIDECNKVLERELSAYRFVGTQIAQMTTPTEIQEVEEALNNPDINSLVKKHLSNALQLMADRQNPDFRNSIKESISAVECVVKAIVGNPSTTLGAALNEIERAGTIPLHNDLKEGFKKLYHYTSDSNGIRHALKEEPTVDFEDAKYMLVTCSTFCNYLTVKAAKAGIAIT